MQIRRYRVYNFRSVQDSGWIDVDRVTSLIGVNESGKTNLLLPLWKFKPAQEGELVPTADYPKRLFGEIRQAPGKYKFIDVEFDCSDEAQKFGIFTGYQIEQVRRVVISRHYDGKYSWDFPDATRPKGVEASDLRDCLADSRSEIEASAPLKGEIDLKNALLQLIDVQIENLPSFGVLDSPAIAGIKQAIANGAPKEPMKTSTIAPRVERLLTDLDEFKEKLEKPLPTSVPGFWEKVWPAVPKFVYYSNYGNLDSEIYLPHVVENLERDDLGSKESAKARTLRVLFKFVKLKPQEILELGREFKDPANPAREPTPDEAEAVALKKKERSILLQSAGTLLTERFKEWWKQGDYRFRFEADGNHFRIWVADDLRPSEIELENRSTGLQWFLSFYLVFLVESLDAHQDSFLLLDEPGLSLHPLAQRDLSAFFDDLSDRNQLIYTTHSPFLIDADRLDRARKVFVAPDGTTQCSGDLRVSPGRRQEGAAYAVYSALNLSISESLLLGCTPIVVEGQSDQHYLTLIKSILIGRGAISPARELVFPPSGGVKTAKAVASMIGSKDDALPKTFLDSDARGWLSRRRHGSRSTREAKIKFEQLKISSAWLIPKSKTLCPVNC